MRKITIEVDPATLSTIQFALGALALAAQTAAANIRDQVNEQLPQQPGKMAAADIPKDPTPQ